MKSWLAAVVSFAAFSIAAPAALADDDDRERGRYYSDSYNDRHYKQDQYNRGYRYNEHRRGYDHGRRHDPYGGSAAIIIRGRGGELVIRANEGAWGQLLSSPYNWRPNYIYHYSDYCDRRGCRVSVHDRFRGHHVGYVYAPPPPRDCYRGRDSYYPNYRY